MAAMGSRSTRVFASALLRCTCGASASTPATAYRSFTSFRYGRTFVNPSFDHSSSPCTRPWPSSRPISAAPPRRHSSSLPTEPHPTPTNEVQKITKQASRSSIFSWGSSKTPTATPEHPSDEDPLRALREREMEKILLRRRMRKGDAGVGGLYGAGTTALDVRCTTLDENGVVRTTAGQYDKLSLCSRYGIPPRDLRKLDSGVPTVVPTILVRRSAILLTILHLRVVITAKEVTLFDSLGTEDSHLKSVFLWDLEFALKNPGTAALKSPGVGSSQQLPYEFRALETCLISVTTALDTELDNIRALVQELLQALEEHIDRDNLRLLLQYSRKLTDFQKRATLVMQCLDEVLENDEDLAAMYMTEKMHENSRKADDHEEVELLLESFSKQCEEIVSEVETLSANVRSTEDIIELILDSNRNSLLGLDLRVSIATMGLTSGALIAGLFGMNLLSRFEEHPYAFPAVSVAAVILAVGVTFLGLRTLRRMRRVGLGWRAGAESAGFVAKRGGVAGEAAVRWGDKWASRKRSKHRRF